MESTGLTIPTIVVITPPEEASVASPRKLRESDDANEDIPNYLPVPSWRWSSGMSKIKRLTLSSSNELPKTVQKNVSGAQPRDAYRLPVGSESREQHQSSPLATKCSVTWDLNRTYHLPLTLKQLDSTRLMPYRAQASPILAETAPDEDSFEFVESATYSEVYYALRKRAVQMAFHNGLLSPLDISGSLFIEISGTEWTANCRNWEAYTRSVCRREDAKMRFEFHVMQRDFIIDGLKDKAEREQRPRLAEKLAMKIEKLEDRLLHKLHNFVLCGEADEDEIRTPAILDDFVRPYIC